MSINSKIEWTLIPNFPNYRINENGDLESKAIGNNWKPKKRYTDRNKYQHYTLGRGVKKPVHILVLTAFKGPKPKGMECRHLDGNPSNNHLSNLTWGTPLENHADQYLHGTRVRGEKHPMAKISDEQRKEIKRRFANGEKQKDLASEFGLTQATVSYLINH